MSTPADAGLPEPLAPDVFARRRGRLAERLDDGVLVLPGTPVLFRSRDTEYPHRPDSELYYLTGVTEPGAVAVVQRDGETCALTLFVQPRDPEAERWSGPRPEPDEMRARHGATEVHALSELGARLGESLAGAPTIYFRLGEHPTVEPFVLEALRRARRRGSRTGTGPRRVADPGLLLDEMRLRKEAEEIARLRRAVAITEEGFRALATRIAPGAGEWELQGVLEGAFRSLGAEGPAFESIVAAGANACVLHHVGGDGRLGADELVLVDAGASFGLMAADITRTFPVSGAFQGPRRAVYEVVEAARAAAVATVSPGATVADVHRAAVRVLTEGLLEMGLIEGTLDDALEGEAAKPFYPHQTSHWLGLDVHDVGDYARDGESRVLEPGMVLTVEPGLYLSHAALAGAPALSAALAGIGVRIEDDVLVTETGAENLTAGLPSDPDSVAELVG
jgi:Xaa-Pro aminopeptidase